MCCIFYVLYFRKGCASVAAKRSHKWFLKNVGRQNNKLAIDTVAIPLVGRLIAIVLPKNETLRALRKNNTSQQAGGKV